MAKQYKWRSYTRFDVPPDPTYFLTHGVTPADQSDWQLDTAGTQHTGTWSYWYHDANTPVAGIYTDANASRVVVNVTQTWSTQIDYHNNLIVTISTIINSIVRDQAYGINYDTPGRYINLYKQEGGQAVLSLTDLQVATNHTIYQGPLDLGSETFTITPGHGYQRSSLFLHNQSIGATSYDDIWCGVQFMNPLPEDYRPGAVLKSDNPYGNVTNGVWMTHNRTNGACHILTDINNNTWKELRTVGAPIAMGNPPSILHDDKWYNQQLLGKE